MTSKPNKKEKDTEVTSESLIGAIGSSAEGIQNTFGSIYSTLEKSLQQNVQMTQSMTQMLDEMFKSNLKIASTLEPIGNGNIRLKLTITNRTRLPTIAMTGTIKFDTKNNEIQVLYKDAYQNENKVSNIFDSPCNLPPQTQYKQEMELSLKELIQCSGHIYLSIPNPLDPKKAIDIKHSFGVYLIDQFTKEIANSDTKLEVVGSASYPIAFIRSIMEIHPIKGIEVGMCIKLTTSTAELKCEINKISNDFNSIDLLFSSNNKEVASKLIAELNILADFL